MQRIYPILLFCLAVVLFQSCRKDQIITDITVDPPTPDVVIIVETEVIGLVVDASGLPVADATVSFETQTTTTDEFGYFKINGSAYEQLAMLQVKKAGYFDAFPTIDPVPDGTHQIKVQLTERAITGTIDGGTGGSVSLPNDSKITLAANSFVDVNGQDYTGPVNVYAHYIDPTRPDIQEIMPGNLLALNTEGDMQGLASFGMMQVELEDNTGQPLQITAPANLEFAIPTDLEATAPNEIPLWHFDEVSGFWIEEGQAVLQGDKYVGEVNHFTFWNCDVPSNFVYVQGEVTVNGQIVDVRVRITWIEMGTAANSMLDDKGVFEGWVPKDALLLLEVIDQCENVLYSEQIGPFSQDVILPPIDVVTTLTDWFTINGQIVDCDGNGVVNGYALVSIGPGNESYSFTTDETGNFEGYLPQCGATLLEVQGVDIENILVSDPEAFTINPVMNIPNIEACDQGIQMGMSVTTPTYTDFLPFVVVQIEFDTQSGNPNFYTITVSDNQSSGLVIYKYYIFDWAADPTNPNFSFSNETFPSGDPDPHYVLTTVTDTEITLDFGDFDPGDLLQFTISDVLVDNLSGSLGQEQGCTVTLTAEVIE